MKQSDLIGLLFAAIIIAAGVSIFLAPRLDPEVDQLQDGARSDPLTAANVKVEPEACDVSLPAKAAILRQKPDSHYWGVADVDGYPVDFMVDTGASIVVLTYEDAERMRLKPDTLDYKWNISTAGGNTKGASVLLETVRFGSVEIENVEAMILRDGLDQNLLGMSFLEQLYSYEFRGKQLIIRQ